MPVGSDRGVRLGKMHHRIQSFHKVFAVCFRYQIADKVLDSIIVIPQARMPNETANPDRLIRSEKGMEKVPANHPAGTGDADEAIFAVIGHIETII